MITTLTCTVGVETAHGASFFSWLVGTKKSPSSRAVPRERYRSTNGPRGRTGVGSSDCRIRSKGCGTGHVRVDVANNCMCVGSSCFKVATGYKTGDIGKARYRRRGGKLVKSSITMRDVRNAQTHNTGINRGRLGKIGGRYNRRAANRCGRTRGAGCRYETTSSTKSHFNYDGMTMSARNTKSGGKWLHQIPGCGDHTFRTQGCIGVPCDKWRLVKSQMGKPMTICGGGKAGYTGPSLRSSTRSSGGQTRLQRRVAAGAARNTGSGVFRKTGTRGVD